MPTCDFVRVFVVSVLSLLASNLHASPPQPDWLVERSGWPARIEVREKEGEITLTNGLVERTFLLAPNFATISVTNLVAGAAVIRGIKPEAIVEIDGHRYEVGGLKGQPDYAYLDRAWLPGLASDAAAFQFVSYTTGTPEPPYFWAAKRHAPEAQWPPAGVTLTAEFRSPENGPSGLNVAITYALYDGMPVLAKWVAVRNGGSAKVVLNGLEPEILAVTEQERYRLHVESNYAFDGMNTTAWGPDSDYLTQIDYNYQMPLLLTSRYPLGPGVAIEAGAAFESFRTYVLALDSDDRERRGLARRRFYRVLAPQVTENPVLMHVREASSHAIRRAVDQCAETGFEMVICTFGSGFDIESEDPDYIARIKEDVEYAHAKGIELGGYTLMCASRDAGPEFNCISAETGQPGSKFGQSACLASAWADGYFARVLHFIDATGIDVIETDGPFHGDVCASTVHAHHRGLEDSQVAQWRACCAFYRALRERGVYIHTPDWYYLNGSNRCGMGYRETNWSLPRERQIVIGRQNIYDGTFEKTPSMGWMFVPLVEYHGGGAAATLEPLGEHLDAYAWHLAQNFGSGVQACYRGPRLYDTDATKAVVKQWTDFYKSHRAILDSDIIHVRRADGQRIDCMLHVNPRLAEKALAMVYNPANEPQSETLRLPLYYAGIVGVAHVVERGGEAKGYLLDEFRGLELPVSLPANGYSWFVIE